MPLFVSDAVVIQLVGIKRSEMFCYVYDLTNTKNSDDFMLPIPNQTINYWKMVFEKLAIKYPPNIVKSIHLNLDDIFPPDDYWTVLTMIKDVGKTFGYSNFCWSIDFIQLLTAQLLETKIHKKEYEIGDHITIALHENGFGRSFLLKKQKIGWDIVDWREQCSLDFSKTTMEDLFTNNKNERIHIKDSLFNDPTAESVADKFMFISCQYLTKVYAGEEYFTDFDYFLGYICEESFKLKLGKTTIGFATILKRLPLTIRKKIQLVKCNKIQLISSFSALNYSNKKEKIVYTKSLNNISEVVIVTLKIDEFKNAYFKIEKDNPQKTLICANVPLNEWKNDYPEVILGKDYCSVKYYKDGLSWRLKDANGNTKIPFKISFDKELYIGDAADEHPEFLMPKLDMETLSNQTVHNQVPDFFLDDDNKYKIWLKSANGTQKMSAENLIGIFIKSILKLLDENLGESTQEIYLETDFPYNFSSEGSLLANAVKSLGINLAKRNDQAT